MTKKTLWVVLGTLLVLTVTIASAQQEASKRKNSANILPAEVCKAIEPYIAKIDAARSIREKAKREEKYAEAQKELAEVLKRHGKDSVMADAEEYARLCETVVSADATQPKLDEILDKRIKLRAGLLGRCSDYTLSR